MRVFKHFITVVLICSHILVISQENDQQLKKLYKTLYKDSEQVSTYIEKAIKTLEVEKKLTIEGEVVHSKKFLPRFYEERGFKPAWSNYESFIQAIEALEGSYQDGLLPSDYNLDGMIRIRDTVLLQLNSSNLDHSWTAELDILLTDAIFLYAFHLFDGKTDPTSLDVDWNFGHIDLSDDAPEALKEAIDKKKILKTIQDLRPDFPGYYVLMEELARYREIHERGGWGTIEAGGKIDPGDSDPRIPLIRKRLAATNDLSILTTTDDAVYDEALEKDIRSFQDRHGLTADGIIGKGTFGALNIPVEKKIDMLRVNLERSRWIIRNIGTDYIVVNIARYKAYVEHNFDLVHETNVMVGRTFHKTPVFRSKLAYLEFNPTWTVPVSITRNEMIPKILKDPEYLKKNHFVLLDGSGKVVPEGSVDLTAISASNFPYTIQQVPGPWNALGEVKFIFPNSHSVFLHDTQAKSLFSQANRTFSHGCIRVQNPHDLAEVLLRGTDWDRQKIDELVASKETKRVYPKIKFDVLLLYWTTGVFGTDKMFYLPDVYERDQAVLKALDEKVTSVKAGSI